MYLYKVDQRKTVVDGGNGHVVSTDYESISVDLDQSLVAEEGTITFTNPGGLVPGSLVTVNFSFIDITLTARQNEFIADVGADINIVMPNPLPADIPAYLARAVRSHELFLASAVTTLAGAVINYRVIRAGIRLSVTANPATTLNQAVTVVATNGSIPNYGAGSAVFYRPEQNITNVPTVTPFRASTGYASVADTGLFFGVIRREDKWQYTDMDCCNPKSKKCPEIVRRGTIQVPLEAPVTLPMAAEPIIQARYAASGAITLTGGFRVVPDGTAPAAGLRDVRNAMLISVVSSTSAIIRLM